MESVSFEEASQLSIFDYLSVLVDRRRRATESFEAELSSRPYTISLNHCKLGSCRFYLLALYAMAPRNRLHDSHWRSGRKDRYTNLAFGDDETGRSLSDMMRHGQSRMVMAVMLPHGDGGDAPAW